MNNNKSTKSKVRTSIAAIVVLFVMLTVTTYALVQSIVSVDDNVFTMGRIKIELNGGQRIFDGSDMNIEPGQRVKKDFSIANTGTADAYFCLYLENVDGPLKEALNFEIYDGDILLFSGSVDEFTDTSACVGDTPLAAGETRILTAVVMITEGSGNEYQNGGISFDITADEEKKKNNPDRAFN